MKTRDEHRRDEHNAAAQPEGQATRGPAGLLLVDDCAELRKLCGQLLTTSFPGLMIDEAPDGKTAIRQFEKRRHAVIILDCRMPDMDGPSTYCRIVELCRKNRWSQPSVILWSYQKPLPDGLPDGIPKPAFVWKRSSPRLLLDAVTPYLAPVALAPQGG